MRTVLFSLCSDPLTRRGRPPGTAGIPRIAAIFELNKDDIHRFLDQGLVPPYFENAFRRYFTLNKVYNYEYEY